MGLSGVSQGGMSRFERVGVVGRPGSLHVVDSLHAVVNALRAGGVDVVVEAATAKMLGGDGLPIVQRGAIGGQVDLVVVVGGDGSILGIARDVAGAGAPVLGVNRGGLGFLADIAPEQIAEKIGAVLAGEYSVDERFLLSASVYRGDELIEHATALNDVVVHAGSVSRMMDFEVLVDGEFVYEQRSDGLIVATPTGSTAYSLSAGGPIMHPGLDAIAIVPMFPHTLTSRPLLVDGGSRISVVIGDAAQTPKVSCDSQVDTSLHPQDEVRIAKHPHALRLAFPVGHNFFESCRSKLDWGSRLGGR